jgi:hypothetical protein
MRSRGFRRADGSGAEPTDYGSCASLLPTTEPNARDPCAPRVAAFTAIGLDVRRARCNDVGGLPHVSDGVFRSSMACRPRRCSGPLRAFWLKPLILNGYLYSIIYLMRIADTGHICAATPLFVGRIRF